MRAPKLKYRITILNSLSYLFILSCVIYTLYKWQVLSKGEGWGVVAMVGLMSIGLIPLSADLILQFFIKKKTTLNLVGLLVGIIITVLLLPHIE